MNQQMTLLQRGVIQRLREAGYHAQADAAHDAWGHGERCRLPNMVHGRDALLREDYEKADRQATTVVE
jgi:hypothetical protein